MSTDIGEWFDDPTPYEMPSNASIIGYLQQRWVDILKRYDSGFNDLAEQAPDLPASYLFKAQTDLAISDQGSTFTFTFPTGEVPTFFNEFALEANVPYYEQTDDGVSFDLLRWAEDAEVVETDYAIAFKNILRAKVYGKPLNAEPSLAYFQNNNYDPYGDEDAPDHSPTEAEEVILHETGWWTYDPWRLHPEQLNPNPFTFFNPDGLLRFKAVEMNTDEGYGYTFTTKN